MSDFIAGMSLGMCVGIAMVAIFYIIQMTLALRNEEKLKKLYISETDERIALIRTKAGGTGIVFYMRSFSGCDGSGVLQRRCVFYPCRCSNLCNLCSKLLTWLYWFKFTK